MPTFGSDPAFYYLLLLYNMHTRTYWGVAAPFCDYVRFMKMSLFPKILKIEHLIVTNYCIAAN